MYTVLKTGKGPHSGNVGDQLVLEAAKQLVSEMTGVEEFLTYNRETDLTSVLGKINQTSAVLMPSFEIRGGIVPYYRFADDITDIEVPIIPLGAGWCEFPGDKRHARTHKYSAQTRKYLSYIGDNLDTFSTRDAYTNLVLERNGIDNAHVVGDCAWYKLDKIGDDMSQPSSIDKLVMTTPHRTLYSEQAQDMIRMLRKEFPETELFLSLHNTPSETDRKLADRARSQGYEVVRASLDTDNIEFYQNCDLHVGYRLHGHIGFLRERLPSVLIHEDGRGAGLTEMLGVGGFNGFRRRLSPLSARVVRSLRDTKFARAAHTILDTQFGVSSYWSNRAIAPADGSVPERIQSFLRAEQRSGFGSYSHIPKLIDRTYREQMKPFINSLPV